MNKTLVILISCFLVCNNCYSQEEKTITNIYIKDTINDDSDKRRVFTKVEADAEFPGGLEGWREFLTTNLNANVPITNGAPYGTYQVIIRFIVSRDGTISDPQAETHHGYGMEAEVIRVLKMGPKWIPAMQNKRQVNAYKRQPVTFVIAK